MACDNSLAEAAPCSPAGQMPGQRKKRRQQQDASRRTSERTAPGTGHWEVIFETQDQSESRAQLRRLRSAEQLIDWTMTRVDTLCGRLVQPTTYQLSLFVLDPAGGQNGDHPDH